MTNRRQFLCLAAGIGGATSLGTAAWLLSRAAVLKNSTTAEGTDTLVSTTRTSWALGSDVSITALHADRAVAAAAVDEAFAELELVESVMSIYRPGSQLSRLNRDHFLDDPHPYFLEVLNSASDMSGRSAGAFDITVQPLWNLFFTHKKNASLPDAESIEQARQLVDWRRVEVSPRKICLRGAGTSITLNGIAQGFATDKALAALRKRGIENALINLGEIGALGANHHGQPWSVGIQHPRCSDAYISLTKLAGRCLATSGDYETRFSDDFRLHHIFDPRTGRSPSELASVSIAAPTGLLADALSTAVFVLGPERGGELVRSTPDADALLVLKDGRTLLTEGFQT